MSCVGGEVTFHYNATLSLASGKKTSGHWFVVESTLPGVQAGHLDRQRRYLR